MIGRDCSDPPAMSTLDRTGPPCQQNLSKKAKERHWVEVECVCVGAGVLNLIPRFQAF